jgi:hypothetical protein
MGMFYNLNISYVFDFQGEKGYFRMLRGKNNCDIEAGVIAGLPIPK